jgi:eukaryotic-like serine/threonine-protein kinase
MTTSLKHLGKYELQETLGHGGMAEVWKALDPQLKRYVAIKILRTNLRSDPDFMERFTREARAIAALRHPNIVQVYDFQVATTDTDFPVPYMVMDYVEGETLATYINATSHVCKYPSPAELLRLFTPICVAVDYAHKHNMIHRDIKPSNILLDKRNTTSNPMGEPILTDFGLVKIMGATAVTLTGSQIIL